MKLFQIYDSGFILDTSAAACCSMFRFSACFSPYYFDCTIEPAPLTGSLPTGSFKWIEAESAKEAIRKFCKEKGGNNETHSA